MDDAFKDIIEIFRSGAFAILKMLILYIILPEFIGILVFGWILRIRGKLLSLLLVGVTFLGFYFFVAHELPKLTE